MNQRWRTLAGLWAAWIFGTSCAVIHSKALVRTVSQAANGRMTQAGFQSFWDQWWWLFVKGYHVLEFLILSLLVRAWLASKPWWWATGLAAAYAASDEFHQSFVSDRGGRMTDWLIDLIGVGLALAMSLVPWDRFRQKPQLHAANS